MDVVVDSSRLLAFPDVEALKAEISALKAENSELKKGKKANPAVVGLGGFAATTLLLQFHNLGWIGFGPIIWVGLIFGGLTQLVAGFLEFSTGNNFGFCAFTSYGCFWMCLSGILVADKVQLYSVNNVEMAGFLMVFTLITLILWIGSMRTSMALFITFTLLLVGFILLDIAKLANSHGFQIVAGIELIFCALSAWYCMAHIVFLETFGKNVLPLGPSVWTYVASRLDARKPQSV